MDQYFVIFLIFLSTKISNGAFDYPCVSPYFFLSSETSYFFVQGNASTVFEGCEARTVWILISNGAHYPDIPKMISFMNMVDFREIILENCDKYSSSELCKAEIELIRNWKLPADFLTKANSLSESGLNELFELGQRLQDYFPHLLNVNNTSNISARITSEILSKISSEALLQGTSVSEEIQQIEDDQLLMNEVNCTAWRTSTMSKELANAINSFMDSKEFKKLVTGIKRRLGFLKPLGFEDIKQMYSLCGYETSWAPTSKSPWCSVFIEDNAKVMEYFWDLKYYYESGYGNPLTGKLGCEIVGDLINVLKEDNKVTLNFGNSLTIRKLLVALDIAGNDEPLEGDGYSMAKNRQWRTSLLTPTEANILVVLYRCEETSSQIETLQIAIFINENLISLPACSYKKMCSLSEFIKIFQPKTDPIACNKDFCDK